MKALFVLFRRADVSHEHAVAEWSGPRHRAIVREFPGLRRWVPNEWSRDGIGEPRLDSKEAMQQAMSSHQMTAAIEDARQCLETERTHALVVDKKTILGPDIAVGRWPAVAAIVLLATATTGFGAAQAGNDWNALLQLESFQSGQSPFHRLSFDITAGEPEIYRAVLTYAAGFRFNGFQTLGSPNTPVGAYELDTNFDGMPERTVALRLLDPHTAYIDLFANDAFSPHLEPVIDWVGGSRFELVLPFGGDADSSTVVAQVGGRMSLVLFPGLLVNPAHGGEYKAVADLETVDPDTDDRSDGRGAEPSLRRFEVRIPIHGPSIVAFARLAIDKFDLKRDTNSRYRFSVHGRFELARSSDGLDLQKDDVTVALDWVTRRNQPCALSILGCTGPRVPQTAAFDTVRPWFRQTISGAEFDRGHGRHYTGQTPGIERFRLWSDDGRFQIDARDLTLMDPLEDAAFTLRIGNDHGTVVVTGGGRNR